MSICVASITAGWLRGWARVTFGQRVALDLGNLHREGPVEAGAGGDHGQHHRVVVVQAHVDVH